MAAMRPEELRDICVAAAEAGGRTLRDLYHRPRDVRFKGRIDLVTDADKASEDAVLKVLRDRAPGASILAEESGAHGGGAIRFIVDPLDGTTNYAHGLPIFACTVAAESQGVVVAGCTVDPMHDETYFASRGEGAVLRSARGDRLLRVSSARELEKALVCTGFPYGDREKLPWMLRAFARFTELAQGSRRLGSAALDLAYVAAGRFDGFWELGLKPWDVAAGQMLVEEAGGRVTRFDGTPLLLDGGEIAASGANLHAAILEVLRATSAPNPSAR
jgi:myo-inositol-1(or 4)-monophosphatase